MMMHIVICAFFKSMHFTYLFGTIWSFLQFWNSWWQKPWQTFFHRFVVEFKMATWVSV